MGKYPFTTSHHVAQGISIAWACDCTVFEDPAKLGAGHTGLSPTVGGIMIGMQIIWKRAAPEKKVQYKDGGMSPSLSLCH